MLMNNATIEHYEGPGGGGEERVREIILGSFENRPVNGGTYPALCWPQLADRVANSTSPVVISVFWDGQNDQETSSSRSAIKNAAVNLAANEQVQTVVIAGVDPENRAEIRHLFGALGDRLFLMGTVVPSDIALLRNRLSDARS